MCQSFKTILVPVDFSINTEVAIKKALEVVEKQCGAIHLFHIVGHINSQPVAKKNYQRTAKKDAEQKLAAWKDFIEGTINTIKVTYSVKYHSSIRAGIEQKIKEIKADLVVIGKKSNHFWLPFLNTVVPNKLCEKTGTAVLTVKPDSIHNKIKTLLVLITNEVPRYKMEAIKALSGNSCLKIYLITFSNAQNAKEDLSASALLKVYQWLRENIHCQVEYSVLHGKNKARSLTLFAEKINADILLLDPSTETKVGWMNRHISDLLARESKVQVLTVHRTNY